MVNACRIRGMFDFVIEGMDVCSIKSNKDEMPGNNGFFVV